MYDLESDFFPLILYSKYDFFHLSLEYYSLMLFRLRKVYTLVTIPDELLVGDSNQLFLGDSGWYCEHGYDTQ
jgi:hypothetical protein